jgi:hypothetical protein
MLKERSNLCSARFLPADIAIVSGAADCFHRIATRRLSAAACGPNIDSVLEKKENARCREAPGVPCLNL